MGELAGNGVEPEVSKCWQLEAGSMVAVLEPEGQPVREALGRKAVQPSDYQRKQKALCLTVVQEGSAARKLTGIR